MKKATLLALTNAVPGKDAEFNHCYDNFHLPDLLACPGVVSARRFDALDFHGNRGSHKYVAVYDIEHDDPVASAEEIFRRFSAGEMTPTDALADDFVAILYSARGQKRLT